MNRRSILITVVLGLLSGFMVVGVGTTAYLAVRAVVSIHWEAMNALRRRRNAAVRLGVGVFGGGE